MTTMFDSIHVSAIPKNAEAVAGYVGGAWPTYAELVATFPLKVHKLSIAVASRYDAECGDFEQGDMPNKLAPVWVKRQIARGVKQPVVYTSVSNAHGLLATLKAAGIDRKDIRLWTAHYTGKPHLCGAVCGFGMDTKADATQYTNNALGRTLDASLCSKTFFGPVAHKASKRKRDVWRHHLHEIQDVGRLVGWSPAMKVAAAKLRRLLGGK
jgi:hypothetical protein